MTEPDAFDLDALQAFRTDDAVPPEGLRERIEEVLMQQVLAEEARIRRGDATTAGPSATARWLDRLFRPATAIGLATSIAVVLAVANGLGEQPVTAGINGSGAGEPQEASLLDGTAAALFGDDAARASNASDAAMPVEGIDPGTIYGTAPEEDGAHVKATSDGALVAQLPRDPAQLLVLVRRAAADATAEIGGDPTDRMAFAIAIAWSVDPDAPPDLRAAFVRSLGGLVGVDPVTPGSDLLGRQGVVLGHVDELTGVRDQVVLQADGGQLLERRSFTTSWLDAACPPGTFTAYAAFDGDAPVTPADAPWARWPEVIGACDPGIVSAR